MQRKKMMFALIAFFAVVSYANAQPSFGQGVDDEGAPIPGLLVAAVVGFVIGARKVYRNK